MEGSPLIVEMWLNHRRFHKSLEQIRDTAFPKSLLCWSRADDTLVRENITFGGSPLGEVSLK